MIGQIVSHYRIIERLGDGGMGVVYKAEDIHLGRFVALKFLPDEVARDPQSLERFRREARAASALNHPHILTVYEFASEGGREFIACELVEGKTIRALIREGFPAVKAIDVVRQVLEALKTTHQAGIIHRDLKPENIMVRSDGYAKVLDFGLSKLISTNFSGEGTTNLTSDGQLLGTVLYMSPEQARGEAADSRSDLFSMGIVLYEMLAGVHPWKRRSPIDTLHAILYDDPPAADFGGHLAPILQKALRKSPSERFQCAEDMLAALSRSGPVSTSPSFRSEPSIAVLPFVFLSAVEEKEALSLGFADALITTLGSVRNLIARPTSAILNYQGGNDPSSIARDLAVQYVLQGNILKLGSQWRVSIQLYDAEARKMVFSQKYEFNQSNVFEIQDEIAARVATSLERKLGAPLSARDRYSSDPGAYDDYLKGLRFSYHDLREPLESAAECFSRAVERDPEFALAHAMLSHTALTLYFGYDPRRTWLMQAETHCQRALQLDPELAEAIMAKAMILWSPSKNFQHSDALACLEKALTLQPNLDHAWNRAGTICSHTGRIPEAIAAFEKSRRVNPFNTGHHSVVQAFLWSGQYARAAAELETWKTVSPESKYVCWFLPQPALLTGDFDVAERQLRESLERFPGEPLLISMEGLLHAFRGNSGAALDCAQRACRFPHSFGHTHHTYYQLAGIHAVLGDTAQGMQWLERSVESGFPCWTFFQLDPSLSNLRPLAEFQSLTNGLEGEFSSLPIHLSGTSH
jgi:eukaryotic-like serine/threonine-protein kinase